MYTLITLALSRTITTAILYQYRACKHLHLIEGELVTLYRSKTTTTTPLQYLILKVDCHWSRVLVTVIFSITQ